MEPISCSGSSASPLHLDVHVATTYFDNTVPLVELLRPVEQERVEAHFLPDGLSAGKLPAQAVRTNAPVLEFGEDQQFVQIDVIVMLGRPPRRGRSAREFNDSERGPFELRIKALPLSALIPRLPRPRTLLTYSR